MLQLKTATTDDGQRGIDAVMNYPFAPLIVNDNAYLGLMLTCISVDIRPPPPIDEESC